jgi:hypothetical protein
MKSVCLMVAMLVLGAAGAAADTPIPREFFAICPIHDGDFPPLPMGTLGHPGFIWANIESMRGVYNFARYDSFATQAEAAGMADNSTNTVNICITLGLTPGWATTDTATCHRTTPDGLPACSAPPDDITDWKTFLLTLIRHYNGVAHPHIKYYELWNEADDASWFKATPKGSYTQLLALAQAADSIIHLDPYSQLLTPSVTLDIGTMTSWMAGYLKAGGAAYADGGAFHGYLGCENLIPFPMPDQDTDCGSIVTKATEMRAVFDTCGLAGKPMFMTEGSWGNFNVVDPDTEAAWLGRFYLLQAGLRASTDLGLVAWFCWGDTAFGWGDLETSTGAPNKAAIAYEQVYQWLEGASMPSPCTEAGDGTWTCDLTRPGGYTAQAVWNVNGSTSYTPPPQFVRYRTLAGDTIAVSGNILVGLKPKLLESGNGTTAVAGAPPARLELAATPSITRGPTRISFGEALPAAARLTIRDVRGRLIRTVTAPAGSTSVFWDGRSGGGRQVGAGVYYLLLDGKGLRQSVRVVVLR